MSKMRFVFVIVISVLVNTVACNGMVILIFLALKSEWRVHVHLVILMHMFTWHLSIKNSDESRVGKTFKFSFIRFRNAVPRLAYDIHDPIRNKH